MQADGDLCGAFHLAQRVVHGRFNHGRGNGHVGDKFLGHFQRQRNQHVFRVANDLRHGLAQRGQKALEQFVRFGALFEQLLAQRLFAVDAAPIVTCLPGVRGRLLARTTPGGAFGPTRSTSRAGLGRVMVSDQEFIAGSAGGAAEVNFAFAFKLADALNDPQLGGFDIAFLDRAEEADFLVDGFGGAFGDGSQAARF